MIRPAVLAMLTVVAGLAAPAMAAERLVTSLSNHRVMVNSSFTGTELVLFGAVEESRATVQAKGGYDLAITVRGPRETVRNRRKDRVSGIWVNVESRLFVEVPAYLAVLTNHPAEEIAAPAILRRQQIGMTNFLLPQVIGPDLGDVVRDDPFRTSFVRLKQERGLYVENAKGVTFLAPTLFRATIPIPAEVPVGSYAITIKLFADGEMVTQTTSAFEVVKVGFEQFVANAAQRHGLLYGLVAALMALATGYAASVVFRRD